MIRYELAIFPWNDYIHAYIWSVFPLFTFLTTIDVKIRDLICKWMNMKQLSKLSWWRRGLCDSWAVRYWNDPTPSSLGSVIPLFCSTVLQVYNQMPNRVVSDKLLTSFVFGLWLDLLLDLHFRDTLKMIVPRTWNPCDERSIQSRVYLSASNECLCAFQFKSLESGAAVFIGAKAAT